MQNNECSFFSVLQFQNRNDYIKLSYKRNSKKQFFWVLKIILNYALKRGSGLIWFINSVQLLLYGSITISLFADNEKIPCPPVTLLWIITGSANGLSLASWLRETERS